MITFGLYAIKIQLETAEIGKGGNKKVDTGHGETNILIYSLNRLTLHLTFWLEAPKIGQRGNRLYRGSLTNLNRLVENYFAFYSIKIWLETPEIAKRGKQQTTIWGAWTLSWEWGGEGKVSCLNLFIDWTSFAFCSIKIRLSTMEKDKRGNRHKKGVQKLN